jgi:hypothetical protein
MQNLLNGWTGLNKNHVIFPGSTSQSLGKSGSGTKSESKSSFVPKADYKSGKIKRTNSFSDIIKEKAIRKALTKKENHGDGRDHKIETEPTTSTSRRISDASVAKSYARSQSDISNSVSNSQSQSNSNSTQKRDNAASFRRGSLDSASIQSSSIPHNTGQYINENAYANQQRSMKFAERSSSQRSIGSSKKASSPSKDGRLGLDTSDDGQHSDLSSLGGSHMETHSFQNHSISHRSKHPPAIPEFQGSDGEIIHKAISESGTCSRCQDAQQRLRAMESDLEYLRSMLINSEYVCISCEQRNQMHSGSSVASKHSTKSKQSMASGILSLGSSSGTSKRKVKQTVDSLSLPENMTLAASSQRLMDTMIRHKRQIEQISKDTSRWQNDMHMKLSKLAMMCKDLNDESASRKEQVELARNDRDAMRQERNAMTSELELLRTRVQMYEKQEIEHAELRQIVREKQFETLVIADQAISQRDSMIEQLTSRLNEALKIIDDEKQSRYTSTS